MVPVLARQRLPEVQPGAERHPGLVEEEAPEVLVAGAAGQADGLGDVRVQVEGGLGRVAAHAGGVAQQALQGMLMQADGRNIILFPAWPREWNVDFKLCAPMKTTVEGVFRAGKLRKLKVSPAERRSDVVVMPAQ